LIPYEPGDEYDVTFRIRRLSGPEGIAIGLVAGRRQILASLDGWASEGFKCGFDAIDNQGGNNNVSTLKGKFIKDDGESKVSCSVGLGEVAVSIDDKPAFSFKGDLDRLGLNYPYGVPNKRSLYVIAAIPGQYQFSSIKVFPITGKGKIRK